MARDYHRKRNCYEEKKVVHIITDLLMGSKIEITLTDESSVHYGVFLKFDRHERIIYFQNSGTPDVTAIPLAAICTVKYG